MVPSMETCFYDILPRHLFIKKYLHRWRHVFAKKIPSKIVIKYGSIDEESFYGILPTVVIFIKKYGFIISSKKIKHRSRRKR